MGGLRTFLCTMLFYSLIFGLFFGLIWFQSEANGPFVDFRYSSRLKQDLKDLNEDQQEHVASEKTTFDEIFSGARQDLLKFNPYLTNRSGWSDYVPFNIESEFPPRLNNSVQTPILIYNAVPKCGSTTAMYSIMLLSSGNRFRFQYMTGFVENLRKSEDFVPDREGYRLGQELRYLKLIYKKVKEDGVKVVIGNHGVFVNSSFHGLSDDVRPNWINIIRDPIDQRVSLYYHGSMVKDSKEKQFAISHLPYSKFHDRGFDTCVRHKTFPCYYPENEPFRRFTYSFFCGSSRECFEFGGQSGLQKAKRVVETIYSVVGIAEEMDKTYFVMENMLPGFLSGLQVHNKDKKNINKHYPQPLNSTREMLLANKAIQMEYDFYNFVKQRLNRQYEYVKATKGHLLSV